MKVTKYFWNGAEIRWESGVGSNIKQFLLRTSGVYTVQQVQQVLYSSKYCTESCGFGNMLGSKGKSTV